MPGEKNKIQATFENITMIMILLVLIQTLLEDLVIYLNLAVPLIDSVKLSAVIFDLFFTIEFIIRLFNSIRRKEGRKYFFLQNGWIDLLASLPLLLFISGPYLLGHFIDTGIGTSRIVDMIGLLKIVKAIRVARILRLMRVLKIFGSIKNINSSMAQRHITVVSTIFIATLITFIMGQSILSEIGIMPSRLKNSIERETEINLMLQSLDNSQGSGVLAILIDDIAPSIPSLLTIYQNDKALHQSTYYDGTRIDFFEKRISEEITGIYELENNLQVVHYRLDYFRMSALDNILNFVMIIFLLIVFIAIYTKHFSKTVTDPIFVMSRGFSSKEFISSVPINTDYADDDIFILAEEYNKRWLPAKLRTLNKLKGQTTKLRRM